ncbi:hypothetical protein IAS59_001636 [Cryptococcus gattii]
MAIVSPSATGLHCNESGIIKLLANTEIGLQRAIKRGVSGLLRFVYISIIIAPLVIIFIHWLSNFVYQVMFKEKQSVERYEPCFTKLRPR